MAAFDPGDDADEMPEIKWVGGFQRSADGWWWSKGDHVGLGKDLVRSSLRALVLDLPTPSEGDLGLANNMVRSSRLRTCQGDPRQRQGRFRLVVFQLW